MSLEYINQELHLIQKSKKHNLQVLAQRVGEAFYLYNLEAIKNRVDFFKASFQRNIRVHYAMKANNHPDILKIMLKAGLGVDVVSGGELKEALDLGFTPQQIIYSGVGKTVKELELALNKSIAQINVESPQELQRIGELARKLKVEAKVAWRMNPDVKAETHPYITTGFRDNKFGMDKSFFPTLKNIMKEYSELKLVGLTLHIGSQIRQIEPFVEALQKILQDFNNLKAEGYPLQTLDVGGGLGINYDKLDLPGDEKKIQEYARQMEQQLKGFQGDLLLEPGRILVGSFGYLLGEVQYIKRSPWKNFAILNTGMNHLIRQPLYQAHHRIQPLIQRSENIEAYDVVGPICESADVLGFDRPFPKLQQGDWLIVEDAGAYGHVMASTYNSHALPRIVTI
ncbi:MAG: diaminopimelate decarboxylase [Bdellovibrionaceae bacterium]|nr:diaminopimelate decarboxylase [Pseudobdellovibrionaceae bacterium]MCB9092899.1 diaminopimelate decarboxylase [Halobacteriovoraceae bacterium]